MSKKVPADAYKQSTTQYIESVSEDELAQAIYFNFGAKFGFGNFSAALSHVQSQINKSHTIIFTRKVEVGTQQNYNDIRINKKSRSKLNTIEKLDSTSVRLDVFAGTFGSHYIESITYGYRIAIYANLESTDQSKITEFSASFNNLTYDASLNASQKAFFSSNKIKIFCNIFSGTATSDAKLTLTNFDDIAKFLSGLKDGSLELEYAPVACKIASFRPLIIPTDFPNIYSMLKPVTGEQVTAPYGVPAGTVIAWYPNVFVGLSDEKITELLPTGWKICDGAVYGNFTTPNLTSRFIMGTNTISELNNTGGSAEHEHNGSIGASTSKDRKDNSRDDSYSASSSHSHSLTIDKSNNLPPFWKLIYIIKLPVN
ncbi:hypothetical protein HGA64_03535 [Candidatus Falkowbacteria bacterium]|nr:hypothetical protein [Candidatus Falkowbacteria bacterium]